MSLDSLFADPRVTRRTPHPVDPHGRAVLYWMQRAQRATDNAALDLAIAAGNELRLPVVVFLGPVPFYPGGNRRHYAFLAEAWPGLARAVEQRGAAFVFRPYPRHSVLALAEEIGAALLVGDENPLREPERWRRAVADRARMAFVTVDADVVVPTNLFAKEEYAARTLRPKIHRVLPQFLLEPPAAESRAQVPLAPRPASDAVDPAAVLAAWPALRDAPPVPSAIRPAAGEAAALRQLDDFATHGLGRYDASRNHPEDATGTSRLSAHLHFGHIGPRTVAWRALHTPAPPASREAYLEQLVVRRELAINFAARNPRYDVFDGTPSWGRATLAKHGADARPVLYTFEQFDRGLTHDPLWNAAQREMVLTGFMHNYLRMYWAKKILEWTPDPAEAFDIAVRLNDRYELDGRDPNGYTGIAWAMGGKHDRPWPERPVFGTVRYMNAAGMKRKIDVDAYTARIAALARDHGAAAGLL